MLTFGAGGTCTMTASRSGEITTTSRIQPIGLKKSAELDLLARDFAYHCTNLRTKLRLSQNEFAKLMGIRNQVGKITVSRWESGTHTPQRKYLERFLAIQSKHDRRK